MTPTQSDCLDFIRWYVDSYECSPSYDNIKDHLKLKSKSGVHRIVKSLLKKGYLRKEPGSSRCLVPVEKMDASQDLYAAATQALRDFAAFGYVEAETVNNLSSACKRIEKRKGLVNGFGHSRGGSLHPEPAGNRLNHHGNIR